VKKFKFTLDKMREYKRQILEREKGYLLGLYSEFNSLEQRYNDLSEDYKNLCFSSENDMKKGISVREIHIYEMKKRAVKTEQEQILIQKRVLENSIEKQRKVVVRISQEVSGLDKLEENQKQEYMYMLEQENQRIVEEFLSFRLKKNKENDVYETSDI